MIAYLNWYNWVDNIIKAFLFKEKEFFIKTIKDYNEDAITDKFELQQFINNHPKRWNYEWIWQKMRLLENWLSKKYSNPVDPIIFIINLYYKEELWIRDIVRRLEEFWLSIPRNTLNNMMKNVFWWELRDNNDITKVSNKKNKAKPLIADFNKKRTGKIVNSNREIVENLITKHSNFNPIIFKECQNHRERIVYIFSLYWIAKNQNEAKLYIQSLQKSGTSMESIAKIITELFRNATKDYNFIPIPKLWWSEINKIYFK